MPMHPRNLVVLIQWCSSSSSTHSVHSPFSYFSPYPLKFLDVFLFNLQVQVLLELLPVLCCTPFWRRPWERSKAQAQAQDQTIS